jgi:hydrogenase maturation protease
MDKNKNNNICIVGIGNALRSDDGVGQLVCKEIESMNFSFVDTITVQQLDTTLIESLLMYEQVVFVDASVSDDNFSFQPLSSTDENKAASFSHHINASMLASLAKQLYGSKTEFHICAIGATQFEVGTTLSEKAKSNVHAAVGMLATWIKQFSNSGQQS